MGLRLGPSAACSRCHLVRVRVSVRARVRARARVRVRVRCSRCHHGAPPTRSSACQREI